MPAMALLRDLQHPSIVAHGDFDLCLVVVGSSPDSQLEGKVTSELVSEIPKFPASWEKTGNFDRSGLASR
jgi:hypothetical protein